MSEETLPAIVGERPEPEAGIALRNGIITSDDWSTLKAIALTVKDTEFVPTQLRGSSPKIMAALLYGREQGLGPMGSLANVNIIDGKPSLSAAIQIAKIRAAGHSVTYKLEQDDNGGPLAMSVHGKRKDGDEGDYRYTIEMARRAGLLAKKNWQNYPEAMLFARAVSQLATFLFADVFMGSPYTAEELGDDTETTEKDAGDIAELELGGQPEPVDAEVVEQPSANPDPEPQVEAETSPVEAKPIIERKSPIVALRREGDPLDDGEVVPAGHVAIRYEDGVVVITDDVAGAEAAMDAQAPDGAPEPAGDPVPATQPPPDETVAPVDPEQLTIEALANEKVEVILKMAVGKPLAWLQGYLAYETAHKNRKGLVDRLAAMIEVVSKDAANAPAEEPAAVPEPSESAEDEDAEVVEGEVVDDPFGERELLGQLKRGLAYIEEKRADIASMWSTSQVLRTASRTFGREMTELEELTDEELGKILSALGGPKGDPAAVQA